MFNGGEGLPHDSYENISSEAQMIEKNKKIEIQQNQLFSVIFKTHWQNIYRFNKYRTFYVTTYAYGMVSVTFFFMKNLS